MPGLIKTFSIEQRIVHVFSREEVEAILLEWYNDHIGSEGILTVDLSGQDYNLEVTFKDTFTKEGEGRYAGEPS